MLYRTIGVGGGDWEGSNSQMVEIQSNHEISSAKYNNFSPKMSSSIKLCNSKFGQSVCSPLNIKIPTLIYRRDCDSIIKLLFPVNSSLHTIYFYSYSLNNRNQSTFQTEMTNSVISK